VEVADGDPNGTWVNTDDIPREWIHYTDPEGYQLLGERFALAAISLINP
jgi:hypothetical protein